LVPILSIIKNRYKNDERTDLSWACFECVNHITLCYRWAEKQIKEKNEFIIMLLYKRIIDSNVISLF